MQGLNFIAIDFETATGKRASVCEAGICVVKDGKVVETKSWLVRPNQYWWLIMQHSTFRSSESRWSFMAWRNRRYTIIAHYVLHATTTTLGATRSTIFVRSLKYQKANTIVLATMLKCVPDYS